jgi:hypothetical protein
MCFISGRGGSCSASHGLHQVFSVLGAAQAHFLFFDFANLAVNLVA